MTANLLGQAGQPHFSFFRRNRETKAEHIRPQGYQDEFSSPEKAAYKTRYLPLEGVLHPGPGAFAHPARLQPHGDEGIDAPGNLQQVEQFRYLLSGIQIDRKILNQLLPDIGDDLVHPEAPFPVIENHPGTEDRDACNGADIVDPPLHRKGAEDEGKTEDQFPDVVEHYLSKVALSVADRPDDVQDFDRRIAGQHQSQNHKDPYGNLAPVPGRGAGGGEVIPGDNSAYAENLHCSHRPEGIEDRVDHSQGYSRTDDQKTISSAGTFGTVEVGENHHRDGNRTEKNCPDIVDNQRGIAGTEKKLQRTPEEIDAESQQKQLEVPRRSSL